MRQYLDLPYLCDGDPMHIFDLHTPDTDGFDTFIYFHGGGLEAGNRKWESGAETLVKHGIALASCEYRMYPTAHFPDFIEDAAAAVAHILSHIKDYGGSGRVFVGGSSAGGYLSMMLCFDARYLAKYGIAPTDIAGFIHDAGQPTSHFNVLREKGLDTRRVIIDETAPLYFFGLEKELPPMLFIVSDHDMENRYEQTMLTLSTLKHFRYDESKIECRVMHGTHCAYCNRTDEDGENVLGKMAAEYIGRH